MKSNFHIIQLFLAFLFGCHKEEVSINTESSEYFPNKVGNQWEYLVTDSTGTAEGVKKYLLQVNIIGSKKLADGKEAQIWIYNYLNKVDTNFVRIESDTVKVIDRLYNNDPKPFDFPKAMYLIPFAVNKMYKGKLYCVDNYMVTKADTLKINNISYFNSFLINYHYEGPNMEYNDKIYFKPNIGVIKLDMVHYDLAPIDHKTWELKSYTLK